MSTKFLFPDWENEDDDSQDLCGRMREMAEEAARRERQGLPEKKEPEPPAPTAKSPRKRANFFSDLVEQIAKSHGGGLELRAGARGVLGVVRIPL